MDKVLRGEIGRKKATSKILPFSLSDAQRAEVRLSDMPIPISEFCKRINAAADPGCKPLAYRRVTDWLIVAGYFCIDPVTRHKTPTDVGTAAGISTERRTGASGDYTVTLYSTEAQKFILDNMDAILSTDAKAFSPDAV